MFSVLLIFPFQLIQQVSSYLSTYIPRRTRLVLSLSTYYPIPSTLLSVLSHSHSPSPIPAPIPVPIPVPTPIPLYPPSLLHLPYQSTNLLGYRTKAFQNPTLARDYIDVASHRSHSNQRNNDNHDNHATQHHSQMSGLVD